MLTLLITLLSLFDLFPSSEPVVGAPALIYQKTILPVASTTYDLGSYTNNWRNVYASGTIFAASVSSTGQSSFGLTTFTNGFISQSSSSISSRLQVSGNLSASSTLTLGDNLIFSTGDRSITSPGTLNITIGGNNLGVYNANGTITHTTTTGNNLAGGTVFAEFSTVLNSTGNNSNPMTGISMSASHASGAHLITGPQRGFKGIYAETVAGATTTDGFGVGAVGQVDGGTLTGGAYSAQFILTGGTFASGTLFYGKQTDNTGGTLVQSAVLSHELTEVGANNWFIKDNPSAPAMHSIINNLQAIIGALAGLGIFIGSIAFVVEKYYHGKKDTKDE